MLYRFIFSMPYNIALIVILVIFLIFAFACGQSLGDIYCAKTQKDKQEAQMGLVFNLLFAGLLGWWAYYEHHRSKTCHILIIAETNKKFKVDPNMMAGLKKKEAQLKQEAAQQAQQDQQDQQKTLNENTEAPPIPADLSTPSIRYDLNEKERRLATDQSGENMNNPGMLI